MRIRKFILVWACLLTACSSGTPLTSEPAPTPETTTVVSSPSPDAVLATLVPSAATGPVTFESTAYPYSVTLPSEVLTRKWHPASRQWNGTEQINSDGPYLDLTGTVDGGMFVLGMPWKGDVASFSNLVSANVRLHACKSPTGVRSVEVAGDPAIAYRQVCLDQPVVRLMLVGQGFGLAISEQVRGGTEDHAIDDLLAWFETFAWRA
jgi:hypothetical protein